MSEQNPETPRKKRSLPLENLVAPLVFILGIAGSIVVLRRFTALPPWVAVLLGAVGFFIVAVGGLWLLSRRR
jgi:hypothetical protein